VRVTHGNGQLSTYGREGKRTLTRRQQPERDARNLAEGVGQELVEEGEEVSPKSAVGVTRGRGQLSTQAVSIASRLVEEGATELQQLLQPQRQRRHPSPALTDARPLRKVSRRSAVGVTRGKTELRRSVSCFSLPAARAGRRRWPDRER